MGGPRGWVKSTRWLPLKSSNYVFGAHYKTSDVNSSHSVSSFKSFQLAAMRVQIILLFAFVGAFCTGSVSAQTGSAGPAGTAIPPAVQAAVTQLITDASKTPLDPTTIYTDVTNIISAAVAALQSGSPSPQAQAQVAQLNQIQTSVNALKTAGTVPTQQQVQDLVTVISGLFSQQAAPGAAGGSNAGPAGPAKKKKPALNVG